MKTYCVFVMQQDFVRAIHEIPDLDVSRTMVALSTWALQGVVSPPSNASRNSPSVHPPRSTPRDYDPLVSMT
jgi:hypothetical protein